MPNFIALMSELQASTIKMDSRFRGNDEKKLQRTLALAPQTHLARWHSRLRLTLQACHSHVEGGRSSEPVTALSFEGDWDG